MVGPLLRSVLSPLSRAKDSAIHSYDTVERGVWYGAALIVTADSGSIYDPHPLLTYEWDPTQDISSRHPRSTTSLDLGPHPADPHSTILPSTSTITSEPAPSWEKPCREIVPGHEIYVYPGQGG